MNSGTEPSLHFTRLTTKRSETPDEHGLRKLCFISSEHNKEIIVFLWLDRYNETEKLQFVFFEKVLEWSRTHGLTTNITNRSEATEFLEKRGLFKGVRTLVRIDDPAMIDDAVEIIHRSVFPLGIKDILLSRIKKAEYV